MNLHATTAFRSPRANALAAQALQTSYDWEELPSLVRGLRRSDFGHSATPVWNATQPMGLLQSAPAAPAPFREVLSGLHVREIAGDEVFEHFFGGN
jgi:hypothetical protein